MAGLSGKGGFGGKKPQVENAEGAES